MPRSTEELYDSVIIAHYEASRHRGTLAAPDLRGIERNPVCGDSVQLDLSLDGAGRRVRRARFQAQGCTVSQAAASILCEYTEGQRLRDVEDLTADEMLKLLQVPLAPGRIRCALLPFRVLKSIVYRNQRPPTESHQ